MIRVMVTGAAGMVGSHLVEYLAPQAEVLGTYFRPTVRVDEIREKVKLVSLDMCNWPAVRDFIAEYRPAVIYHLAAQSLPTVSWADPWDTLNTNVQGTINIFEGIRNVRGSLEPNYDPMVVVACSSAEYGASLIPERVPIGEDAPLLPLHPYGVSKVAQDLLSYQYWQNFRIRCIRARIFNTTGPRKRFDVVSDFAARIAQISRSGGKLRVGNLDAKRAIMDVGDLIAALVLLAERGEPGEVYNICGSDAWKIGDLIPKFEEIAGVQLEVEQDPALLRPSDEAIILGDNRKLKQRTGWRPSFTIDQTLRRMFEYALAHPEDCA